jgi:hypothetical protein
MTHDPIHAALEAAAIAVMDDSQRGYAAEWHDGRPGPGAFAQAAAAIVAFNATLVSHFHSIGRGDLALDLESIAEAVEEAHGPQS